MLSINGAFLFKTRPTRPLHLCRKKKSQQNQFQEAVPFARSSSLLRFARKESPRSLVLREDLVATRTPTPCSTTPCRPMQNPRAARPKHHGEGTTVTHGSYPMAQLGIPQHWERRWLHRTGAVRKTIEHVERCRATPRKWELQSNWEHVPGSRVMTF